jgi:hypothetical protein
MLREQSTWAGNFYSAGRIFSANLQFINKALSLRAGFGDDLAPSLADGIAILRSETMNLKNFWATSLALALALAFLQVTLQAQTQSQAPNAQQDQQKSQTFVGKVVKATNGQYALLMDEQAGKGVYLDDQEKAKQFEGKNVKVTGVLETAKNLVHITNIEPA